MIARALLAIVLSGAPALAADIALPANAALTVEESEDLGSFYLPIGPYQDGAVDKLVVEGAVSHQAWRIRGSSATTLQILAPMRDELVHEGYKILFECETNACGGFDFRFETLVLAEPDMHVDLGDFRYVAAGRFVSGEPEYLSILVSRSSDSGFVQMTTIGAAELAPVAVVSTKTPEIPIAPISSSEPLLPVTTESALAERLEATGAVVLDDLGFATGSSALEPGEYASLSALAAYLLANPTRKVTLVGHTDAEGALAGNIALSQRRAASVADRLVKSLGVSRAQIAADGVGYLSPRASNLEAEGRTLNRRVEVILTSTE